MLDRARCIGMGICESLAPEVFEVNDDGELVVLHTNVPAGAEIGVAAAVEGCPTQALSLEA